jgi:hypothetical protein
MKRKKIQDFVESLVDSSLPEEQQSVVLTSDLELVGGTDNTDCTNNSTACQNVSNEKCTNSGSNCKGSKNSNCLNVADPGTKDPSTNLGSTITTTGCGS